MRPYGDLKGVIGEVCECEAGEVFRDIPIYYSLSRGILDNCERGKLTLPAIKASVLLADIYPRESQV